MNGISHKQAIKWINRRLDGLLTKKQLVLLNEHLRSCDTCSAYAAEIELLPAHLQNEFHVRWDKQPGPSQAVIEHVTTIARRISMTNRISAGVKLFAGAMTLILLAVVINFTLSRLQSPSSVTNATETVDNALLPANRLLAFTSDQNGNVDIYTMHADGSGLTNVTNHPAYDGLPFWSPDGKQIAFTSDRDGASQIYLMDTDGSNVIQLTDGKGSYGFDGNGYNPWSPDGRKLIVGHAAPGEQNGRLYVTDINDKSTITLTNEAGQYLHPSWSPDGKHIAFTSYNGSISQDLFIVASDGSGLAKLTGNLSSGEFFMFDYVWSPGGTSIFFTTDRNQHAFQKTTYTSTVYEAQVDGSVSIAVKATGKRVLNWWNGTALQLEENDDLRWLRPDGSESSLELCQNNSHMIGIAHKQSHNGNFVVGSHCSDSGWILYWASPDGTITHQLLNLPITTDESLFYMSWSPDDRYLVFVSYDTTSPDVTETLYVLDVSKARENPSIQPVKMPNSSNASWQPIP